MSDTNTARGQLLDAIVAGLAAMHDDPQTAERNRPGLRMAMRNVYRLADGRVLDEYDTARWDELLTEAARLLTSTSGARLDAIDEDDRDPSDWEQHQEWCDAAAVLLAARTTTAPIQQED